MATKKAEEKKEETQVPTVQQLNEAPAGNVSNVDTLLEEFYRTHRVPDGYAYNATWPDKIRKVK